MAKSEYFLDLGTWMPPDTAPRDGSQFVARVTRPWRDGTDEMRVTCFRGIHDRWVFSSYVNASYEFVGWLPLEEHEERVFAHPLTSPPSAE